MRQVCCVKINDFPLKCEEMRNPSLRDIPYVITRDCSIAHISPLAAKAGVDFKMSINLVKSVYPSVRILPYDSEFYASVYKNFLDAYVDCSPAIEPVRDGEAFIDLTGIRDEVAEIRRVVDRVRIRSRVPSIYMTICSSTSKLISRIGANLALVFDNRDSFRNRFGRYIRDAGADYVFLKIGDESKADFIKGFPIQCIWSADKKDIDKLYQLGIKRIGDIRCVPVSVLAAQIGDSAYKIYELSYGIDPTPVYPCYPEMELREKKAFESGISSMDVLIAAVEDMLRILIKRLTDMNMTASSLTLEVCKVDRGQREMVSYDKKFKQNTSSQRYIGNVLRQIIHEITRDNHPGDCSCSSGFCAIEEICIRLKDIKALDPGKIDLFDDLERKERERRLEKAMHAIESRFGADKIEFAGSLAGSRHDQLRAILDVF
mgnify:CR=1 FL=1